MDVTFDEINKKVSGSINNTDKPSVFFENGTIKTNLDFLLFCKNSGGQRIEFANIKLYDIKIYKNNVLVYNAIPCYRKSDQEVGLYDLIGNVFYTNQGTGSFLVGPDV